MRLDKLLVNLKYGSRTEIKKMVKNNLVTVNNEVVKDSGMHIDENNDLIFVNGKKIRYQKYIYLMMNKPSGYISATFDSKHKTVIDLLDEKISIYDVFPCGRLDIDTEGLLILSNDGQFAHHLTHPKKAIYKTYYVELNKSLYESDVKLFKEGMEILDGNNEPFMTKKAILEIIDDKKAYVSITEGKFHQIKRMFQKVNKVVTYLKRVQIGSLKLDDKLALGAYKELSKQELDLLFINENKMEVL